jgi:hypothetical protein
MKYTIFIDDKYNLNENGIVKKINSVIHDKRGWTKFGYTFEYIEYNTKLKNKDIDLIICFKTNKEINNICKFDGLSCADFKNNVIYFNIENWLNGKSHTKLSLSKYRTMLINHELAHILDKHHLNHGKKNTLAPIRLQQTKLGIGDHKPNCFPTKRDFIED